MTTYSSLRSASTRTPAVAGTPVLDVRDLQTQFFTDAGIVRAVDDVSFSVAAGETLGIVGESGSGKSVTALSLTRLLEEPARIVRGEVRFQGRDVLAMSRDELRALRDSFCRRTAASLASTGLSSTRARRGRCASTARATKPASR